MKIDSVRTLFEKLAHRQITDSDTDRQVRFIVDGFNSWRVVWADEQSRK